MYVCMYVCTHVLILCYVYVCERVFVCEMFVLKVRIPRVPMLIVCYVCVYVCMYMWVFIYVLIVCYVYVRERSCVCV